MIDRPRQTSRQTLRMTLGAAVAITGLAVVQPLATVVAPVALAAVVIEGSSTNQSGDGIETFFGSRFDDGNPIHVNFLTGPFGISQELAAHAGEDNTVLSSGWGAANASLLISYLRATDPDNPMLTDTTWILDNNVANPNGGFGTRYPVFAVIGVNPIPTPGDTGATIVSTAYEYDINGNTPKYILNPVADANSWMAYFSRRLSQPDLPIPVDADGQPTDVPDGVDCTGNCQYTVTYDDGTTVRVQKVGSVTYVSYKTEHLPLVQPLRDYGGDPGTKLADAVEPALTAVVNWGYPDNDALANPDKLERAGLVPTRAENRKFVADFRSGVQAGLDSLNGGQSLRKLGASTSAPADRVSLRTITEKVADKVRAALPQRSGKSAGATAADGQ